MLFTILVFLMLRFTTESNSVVCSLIKICIFMNRRYSGYSLIVTVSPLLECYDILGQQFLVE